MYKHGCTGHRLKPILINISLGHMHPNRIKAAIQRGTIKLSGITYDKIKDMSMPLCEACMKGRMRQFNSQPTTNHDWKLFNKVAVDYVGPFRILNVILDVILLGSTRISLLKLISKTYLTTGVLLTSWCCLLLVAHVVSLVLSGTEVGIVALVHSTTGRTLVIAPARLLTVT